MFNLFKSIWEYLFSPWKIEVISQDEESWTRTYHGNLPDYHYTKTCVTYKYTHRFRPEVRIVKKYLN